MSGLRKAKKYNWKDSNLALFGSKLERQVKKASAESEAAWKGAGTEVGLQIWRIVKFKVEHWPKEDYGKFYDGDSYIILNTFKKGTSENLKFDVHFWIGKNSSQDEYGTAAYKTVELDTLLDDAAVQHREVMGHESDMFKKYFKTLTTMKGGADTGFRHVEPTKYKHRLLRFNRDKRTVSMTEVPCNKDRLKSDDVFILDLGMTVYQWNGSESNKDEKFHAAMWLQNVESERPGCKTHVIEQGGAGTGEFYNNLDEDDDSDDDEPTAENALYRLCADSGSIEFNEIKKGDIHKSDLGDGDVYVFYTPKEVFVYVGKGASPEEKHNGMPYAHEFLKKRAEVYLPISVVRQGTESPALEAALCA